LRKQIGRALEMKCRTHKKRPVRRSRFFASGASCQAALHGCPPAEIAAIYFAAQQHPSETNPLRAAALSQKKGRAAATRFVSRKNELPRRFSSVETGCFFASRVLPGTGYLHCEPARLKGAKPMARVKRGTKRRARRKKYLKRTKGFFPHQEQALPVGAGSREPRRSLRVSRSPRQEASISPLVDSAHRSSRSFERHYLRPTHSRPEGRRSRTGPQGSCRHRGKRRSRFCAAGRESQSFRAQTGRKKSQVIL